MWYRGPPRPCPTAPWGWYSCCCPRSVPRPDPSRCTRPWLCWQRARWNHLHKVIIELFVFCLMWIFAIHYSFVLSWSSQSRIKSQFQRLDKILTYRRCHGRADEIFWNIEVNKGWGGRFEDRLDNVRGHHGLRDNRLPAPLHPVDCRRLLVCVYVSW